VVVVESGQIRKVMRSLNSPLEVADRIFYSALLIEYATAEVTISSTTQTGTRRNKPASGRGVYRRSAHSTGRRGM
jgi:hypothetical protein